MCLIALACSSGGDDLPEYQPLSPERLPMADTSTFDVDWNPDVIVALESDVLADVDNLQPANGVFRIRAGSPMLAGVEVGSTVVWPQLGLFEITSMMDEGDRVAVGTEWALFSESMSRADIQFGHQMRDMGPGSVIGVAPAEGSIEGGLRQALFDEADFYALLEQGVAYSGGTWSVNLGMVGDAGRFQFMSSNGGTSTAFEAMATGLEAEGSIRIDESDPDSEPTVRLHFPGIDVTGNISASFEAATGSAEILPPATLVFPFMLGPLPAFVAVSVRVAVQSTVGASATMTVSSSFDLGGTVTLSRGPEGFGIEGGITRFSSVPEVGGSATVTVGASIDVDAPRVTFGFGRPGIATAAIFMTHSAEAVANVAVDPSSGEFCARVSVGSSVLYGGEVTALGWSVGTGDRMLGGIRSPDTTRGTLCE